MTKPRRPVWRRVGWQYWSAAAVAAILVSFCTVNSFGWINRPFPGFLLWENFFVPAIGGTDWTGYQADVPFHSYLSEVNGQPVTSVATVYELAERAPLGSLISYRFTEQPSGQTRTIAIPTMRLTLSDYLLTLGNYLAVGVLLALLGFTVYWLRPDAPAAFAMLIAGAVWGIYFVTAADIYGPAWFRPLCLTLRAVGPAALVHLALTFPTERTIVRRSPRLLPILYMATLATGIADNVAFHRSHALMLAINRLNSSAFVLGGLLLIGLPARAFFASPSAADRQRIKIAALGGMIAFLAPVVGLVMFYLLEVRFPLNFLTLSMAMFPLSIGYAIVRHDLFEVDAIIRRTVAWAILSVLIATIYLGGVGTLEVLFTGRSGRVGQLLFLLAIVAAFNPLRDRVQNAVDFLFARDRYDYRRTVTTASQALTSLLDLEAVVGRILQTITDAMHVESGSVWLQRGDGDYRLQAVAGAANATLLPQQVAADTTLVRRLAAAQLEAVSADSGEPGPDLAGELDRLGAHLVIPMTFEHRLTGFLALGGKASGRFYSREDIELLRTLANQGAVAVTNAHSYQALIEANDRLRTAQAQLIQAERFAAIGEVSAAVAHGIRNPLAGIKAAAQFANMELPAGHPLRENIADVISEADKLEARIKALLDFAKPFEPRRAPCRVDDLVAAALASLRSQVSANGITVVNEINAALPEVQLDSAQIVEVILVLLSNAIEAMPTGGRLGVSAALTTDREHVRVAVSDTGRGISAEQMPRLFKLFATTKANGNGIGLAVAKKIVERHGGRISAESSPGQGTCFTIELPLTGPS